MAEAPKILLAEWIDGVRAQITEARGRYAAAAVADANGHTRTGGFALQLDEITLEAQVVAESSADKKGEVKLYVLSLGGGLTTKQAATQKIVLKFKPTVPTAGATPQENDAVMLGPDAGGDAFHDR
jgi:hypothetical protein